MTQQRYDAVKALYRAHYRLQRIRNSIASVMRMYGYTDFEIMLELQSKGLL